MFPIGNPFNDLWHFVTSPFEGLVGWGGDKIFEGISNWIAKGCVQLLGFVWSVMDRTASPHLNAEWFSGTVNSPYQVAARIGGLVLLGVFFVSIAHGVATGDVGGVMRRAFADLPITVFVMLALVTLTQAAVGLTDAMSDSVWEGMRANAVGVFDGIGRITTTVPGGTFLAPLVLVVLMIALLCLWFVLMLRDSLIYLVVVLAIAFGLPGMVWPTLRGMARHTIELLAALILAKPVIAFALSVGVGALGGVGATGTPGDGIIDKGLAEFGTLVVGIITFGLAAFMPYLVYRLIPLVAAATVAAGVASGPLRAASTGMQFQYYAQSTMSRLSSGRSPAEGALDGGGGGTGGSAGSPGGSGGAAMSGARMAGSAGAGAGSVGSTAGAAGGPVGVAAVVVASAARKAASAGTRAASAPVPNAIRRTGHDYRPSSPLPLRGVSSCRPVRQRAPVAAAHPGDRCDRRVAGRALSCAASSRSRPAVRVWTGGVRARWGPPDPRVAPSTRDLGMATCAAPSSVVPSGAARCRRRAPSPATPGVGRVGVV